MAARDQKRDERWRGWVRLQQRREQVAFHVVHSDGRQLQRPGQRTRRGRADQQCADQAGARCIGNTDQIGDTEARLSESLANQRDEFAHVITRGQFRHYPTIIGVHADLAVQRVREQAAGRIEDRHTGLVARAFDPQNGSRGQLFCKWQIHHDRMHG